MESLEELVRGISGISVLDSAESALCGSGAGACSDRGHFGQHVIRKMNNQVRRDMAATMLQMSHGEFHKRQTGEYLSGFTKDIDQMEHLAWGPFLTGSAWPLR